VIHPALDGDRFSRLIERLGGAKATAARANVSASAVERWMDGSVPRPKTQLKLGVLFAKEMDRPEIDRIVPELDQLIEDISTVYINVHLDGNAPDAERMLKDRYATCLGWRRYYSTALAARTRKENANGDHVSRNVVD
jgi:hypothetical protein